MSPATTLNGHRVTHVRAHLPAWGIWWCEVSLDEEVTLAGRVSLVIADLTLSGTILSGGPGPKGRSSFRVAGGAGGWGRTVPARSYANDAGVKVATVLVDAATACGETLEASALPPVRLGPAFVRAEGPAARSLEQIFPAGWYVGEDGTTRIGKRPSAALKTPAVVVSVDLASQTIALAAESIAGILPGAVVEGITAVDVLHELAPGSLRSTLWGSGVADTSRTLAALRRIIEQLDPRRKYRGTYEYRVVTQSAGPTTGKLNLYNLQPVRVSVGMPDLQRVPLRAGIAGARADVTLGSRVLVTFVDADPWRPVVVAFEDAESGGFLPAKLDLDATDELNVGETVVVTKIAGGVLPAARQTDQVICGPFIGTIVGGSARTRIG